MFDNVAYRFNASRTWVNQTTGDIAMLRIFFDDLSRRWSSQSDNRRSAISLISTLAFADGTVLRIGQTRFAHWDSAWQDASAQSAVTRVDYIDIHVRTLNICVPRRCCRFLQFHCKLLFKQLPRAVVKWALAFDVVNVVSFIDVRCHTESTSSNPLLIETAVGWPLFGQDVSIYIPQSCYATLVKKYSAGSCI